MFEDALLESARRSTGKQRTISTAASLLLQTGFLAAFIVLPLIARQAMPDLLLQRRPIWIPQLDTPAPEVERSGESTGSAIFVTSRTISPPSRIGKLDRRPSVEDVAPAQIGTNHTTATTGLPDVLGNGSGPVIPENPRSKHAIASVLERGVVVSRVQPVYPHLAIVNRIQGSVHINATISSTGALESVRAVSGDLTLARAALDAVRQWRFRPYVLNGKPIEVQTEVIVNFTLN
jgi:periplasmic protein TonB